MKYSLSLPFSLNINILFIPYSLVGLYSHISSILHFVIQGHTYKVYHARKVTCANEGLKLEDNRRVG
jgi:hypothetical protein